MILYCLRKFEEYSERVRDWDFNQVLNERIAILHQNFNQLIDYCQGAFNSCYDYILDLFNRLKQFTIDSYHKIRLIAANLNQRVNDFIQGVNRDMHLLHDDAHNHGREIRRRIMDAKDRLFDRLLVV